MTLRPRFHLLLDSRAGWRAARLDDELEVAEAPGGGVVRLRAAAGEPLADAEGSFAGLAPPRGTALGRDGTIYRLRASAGRLERLRPCDADFAAVDCLGGPGAAPRHLEGPSGLAVTRRGDLWIAEAGNRRVQVFTVKGWALRRVIAAPGDPPAPQVPPWQPWDVAAAGDRVWVADREGGRVHRFDLLGRWRGEIAAEEDGVPLALPVALAVDGAGRLYVAQEGIGHVAVFDCDGRFLERAERRDQVEERFACPWRSAALDSPVSYRTAGSFVSEALDSRLERCLWHRVALGARVPHGTLIEIETFTSEAAKSDAEIAALPDSRWTRAASLTPPEVAATRPGSDWDALVQSPPGRYLWLRLTLLGDGTATPELARARLGFPRRSSLGYLPAVYQQDRESRGFLERFLSILDATLGGVRDTLDELPRYVDPLATPAGGDEGDFLSWLAGWLGMAFTGRWSEAKRRRLVAEAHRLFARRGTPEGLALHVEICAGVRPRILEHYKLRRWIELRGARPPRGGSGGAARRLGDGELWGDEVVRRLELDVHSRIGTFQLVDSGDPSTDPFAHLAHRFTVYLPLAGAGAAERAAIQRVVEAAKPAHTEADVVFVEPRLRVGRQARIGIDTMVARYPEGVELGGAALGRGSVLGPSDDEAAPPRSRVGERSRLGSGARLD